MPRFLGALSLFALTACGSQVDGGPGGSSDASNGGRDGAPPSGERPDPQALPAADFQLPVTASAYAALPYFNAAGVQLGTDPVTMPSGSYYLDPTTGVKIVRITTATTPMPAPELSSGPDYSSGGNRIGRPTNGVYPMVLQTSSGGNNDFHIVTFDINSLAVTKRMDCPGGNRDISRAFSYVTPDVLYTVDGGVIHKWDVSGSSAVEITDGRFPKDLSDKLHGESFFTWLQVSADDRWFAMRPGFQGDWMISWDSQTDTEYQMSAAFDEHKQDKSGRYCLITNSNEVYDPVDGVIRQFSGAGGRYLGHNDTARGYGFGADSNANPAGHYYVDLSSSAPALVEPDPSFYISNLYTSGNWVDQPADLSQWVCVAHQTGGSTSYPNMQIAVGGIAVTTLDGSQRRLLAHNYGLGDVNGTTDYLANSVWPNFAPDGRFLLFKSNQLQESTMGFAFVAILPTAGD
jgi:hypothetical protein